MCVRLAGRHCDNPVTVEHPQVPWLADPATALTRLVDLQVDFVVANRELARVYIREINNLPEADRRRLRRKQRLYVEEWVALVQPGRMMYELGGVSEEMAREAFKLASTKLPIATRFMSREGQL